MTTTARNTYKRIFTALAALAAAFVLLFGTVGCSASNSDCQGDPGKVTAKEAEDDEYELTIQRADGTTYEKDDMTSTGYGWYKVGGKFPHPTKCENGKVAED